MNEATELAGLSVLDVSRLSFSFPFIFNRLTFADGVAAVSAVTTGQCGWGGRKSVPVWEERDLALARKSLLPHLANHLNPKPPDPDDAAPRPVAGRLWRLSNTALALLRANHNKAEWALHIRKNDKAGIPISFEDVELSLFAAGSGILTLQLKVASHESEKWFDVLHHMRYSKGIDVSVTVTPVIKLTREGAPQRGQGPFLNADGVTPTTTDLDAVIKQLLTFDSTSWTFHSVYHPDHLIPFASLFLDGVGCDRDRELHLAYRLKGRWSARQAIVPGAVGLEQIGKDVLDYRQGAFFVAAVDGAGFLCCDPDTSEEFWTQELPYHLQEQYIVGFSIVLAQRIALIAMSRDVAENWPTSRAGEADGDRQQVFGRLVADLLNYTAILEFKQIFHSSHHQDTYGLWRRAFAISELYEEVRTEVDALREYLNEKAAGQRAEQRMRAQRIADEQERRSKHLEGRLSLMSWMLGVPVWLFVVVNSSTSVAAVRYLFFGPPPGAGLQWYDPLLALGVDLVGIGVALLLYRLLSRPQADRSGATTAEAPLQATAYPGPDVDDH